MWFRRDLRLADNPALLSAVSDATDARVVPLFVLDPALWRPAGPARRAYLAASLTDLGNRVGGLLLRRGEPVEEVVAVARAARATAVHIAEDFGPYGRQRDHDVEAALARHDIVLVRTGSPYAVAPGRVVNKNRDAYRMFTPYSRTWREHGWPAPPMPPRRVSWMRPLKSDDLDDAPTPETSASQPPGSGPRTGAGANSSSSGSTPMEPPVTAPTSTAPLGCPGRLSNRAKTAGDASSNGG